MLKPLSPQRPGVTPEKPARSLPTPQDWHEIEHWWLAMAQRLGVPERGHSFFRKASGPDGVLERATNAGGDPHYLLFVLLRYWIPAVLPPAGRERVAKNDQDYWLECEQILKAAASRLRELKPLIELLTAPNPITSESTSAASAPPVVEVELARMLDGIAEVAGSYGGPDYTSVIKNFDPVPLRQTQPFKHNKKNSAELWVIFLLREHFRSVGLGKDRYWPLIADIIAAAEIYQPNGLSYAAEELKSWWQKNWPRTYTQLEQKHVAVEPGGAAYRHDFD
jgi:hypothetical protein